MIKLAAFRGLSQKVSGHLLAENQAQDAHNARLESGAIEPFRGLSLVTSLPKAGPIISLFRYLDQYWFHWDTRVHAVKGPIPGDTEDRVYFTGDGVPKMTYASIATSSGDGIYPSTAYDLGVPAPASGPTATVQGTPTDPESIVESRAYVYTFVTAKGEEGPPSPASAVVDWQDGQTVDLTGMEGVPTGNYNVTAKRIYRVGGTGTSYLFVKEIGTGTSATDDVAAADLGEELPSTDWDPPPSDLHSLIALPNGSLAGLSKNQLCLSVPYVPHAWPVGYRYTLDYDGLALGAFGQSIVVPTEGPPYLATGADPRSMSLDDLETSYPCMSDDSLVDMGYSVVYAGSDGLISVSRSGVQNITESLFSKTQWRALKPETMKAFRAEDKYLCFYDDGTTQGAFLLDSRGEELTFIDLYVDGGWADPKTNELFLLDNDQVYEWDAGSDLTHSWKSKVFRLPRPVNFAAARIEAAGYPVHLKVWADGDLKFDADVASSRVFTLPGGFLSDVWEFELSGTAKVQTIEMAQSVEELRSI